MKPWVNTFLAQKRRPIEIGRSDERRSLKGLTNVKRSRSPYGAHNAFACRRISRR